MSKSNSAYKIKTYSRAVRRPLIKEQPKRGKYEKHKQVQPKLKKPALPLRSKLALLSEAKWIYFAQLLLLCLCALLLPKNLLTTRPGAWQSYVQQEGGLFGDHNLRAMGYALLLFITAAIAALPLYTRVLFSPLQLLPAILLQFVLLAVLWRAVLVEEYFGKHLQTVLTPAGWIFGGSCLLCLMLQFFLLWKYRRIPRVES